MIDSFVALNIYKKEDNKKELFGTGIPFLIYCNNLDNLHEDLLLDDKFRKMVEDNCLNVNNYVLSFVGYFDFKGENNYFDTSIPIQELFSIDKLSEREAHFVKEYLNNIFVDLYEISMKEMYDNELMFDIDGTIVDIYQKLQEKFKTKIVKSTVINYVRSELVKKNLITKNVDLIIVKLENILKDET